MGSSSNNLPYYYTMSVGEASASSNAAAAQQQHYPRRTAINSSGSGSSRQQQQQHRQQRPEQPQTARVDVYCKKGAVFPEKCTRKWLHSQPKVGTYLPVAQGQQGLRPFSATQHHHINGAAAVQSNDDTKDAKTKQHIPTKETTSLNYGADLVRTTESGW